MKLFLFRTFCVSALAAYFFVLGNSASAYWEINSDTVWKLSDSPIVTRDSVWVKPGIKLTIEPGVVVKFAASDPYKRILINQGYLEAIGTPDKPIIFTSYQDDAAGGDTNGDGTASSPQPGDWWYLTFQGNNSLTHLSNVIIRYGGYTYHNVVDVYQSQAEITNTIITDNGAAIDVIGGNLTLTNSSIYNNLMPEPGGQVESGIQHYGWPATTVLATNNWWGTVDGPCPWTELVPPGTPAWQVDYVKVCGLRSIIDTGIVYSPWLTQPSVFAAKRHPVIIIPGILGSWPDDSGKLVLDPITHTYDDLYAALDAADYTPGVTLFTFPYQWRYSNVITAKLLKDKIANVKAVCIPSDEMDCTKVDLVAHSMGGLVARQYIESDDYNSDVDQLIFIAVPHKGAPKAYATWEGGFMGEKGTDRVLWTILALEAYKRTGIWGDAGLVTYIHDYNIDSVKELLPVYNYIYDQDAGSVRYYPDNYPANPFLENLNAPVNLDKLKDLAQMINIIGNTGDTTISSFNVVSSTKPLPLWENGMPKDFYSSKSGILKNSGDDTVPTISNSNFLGLSDVTLDYEHGEVVGQSQKEVIKNLTGKEPETEIHSNKITNLLMLSLACPADIEVIAPDGKRIGRDFSSGVNINEISGAYYYNPGSDTMPEFAVIPNPSDGAYQVKINGTDSGGSYALSADYLSEATSTGSSFAGAILPGQERTLSFDFSSTSTYFTPDITANITINTAISDITLIYNSGLLTNNLIKQKLLAKYAAVKLKAALAGAAIKLAENARTALANNSRLSDLAKAKLLAALDSQIAKLKAERKKIIFDSLSDITDYAASLKSSGVLSHLGMVLLRAITII